MDAWYHDVARLLGRDATTRIGGDVGTAEDLEILLGAAIDLLPAARVPDLLDGLASLATGSGEATSGSWADLVEAAHGWTAPDAHAHEHDAAEVWIDPDHGATDPPGPVGDLDFGAGAGAMSDPLPEWSEPAGAADNGPLPDAAPLPPSPVHPGEGVDDASDGYDGPDHLTGPDAEPLEPHASESPDLDEGGS